MTVESNNKKVCVQWSPYLWYSEMTTWIPRPSTYPILDLPDAILLKILASLDDLRDLGKVWLSSQDSRLRTAVKQAAESVVDNQNSWKMFEGAMVWLVQQDSSRVIVFQADRSQDLGSLEIGQWLWLMQEVRVASKVIAYMKKVEHRCYRNHSVDHAAAFLQQLDRIPPHQIDRLDMHQFPADVTPVDD